MCEKKEETSRYERGERFRMWGYADWRSTLDLTRSEEERVRVWLSRRRVVEGDDFDSSLVGLCKKTQIKKNEEKKM